MYIISGNKHKIEEYQVFFPEIEPMSVNLHEIQELDVEKIQDFKVAEALKQCPQGEFVLDDVSFYLDCLPGLPGPFIKWFNQTLGKTRMVELVNKYGNTKSKAVCTLSYVDSEAKIHHFVGEVEGDVVEPRGDMTFGFDAAFQPYGESLTYGEMGKEYKNKISHRGLALQKLKVFLGS